MPIAPHGKKCGATGSVHGNCVLIKEILLVGSLNVFQAFFLGSAGCRHYICHPLHPPESGLALLGEHGYGALFILVKLHAVIDVEGVSHLLHIVVGTDVGELPALLLVAVDERLEGGEGELA